MNEQAKGSDIVLRGLMLLALLLMVAVGSFAIFFRRPSAPSSGAAQDRPQAAATMLLQPTASFPGSLGWAALFAYSEDLPSAPGWAIRYQAVRNLAYLGGSAVPWNVYAEMLDEHRQLCNFRTRLEDGRVVVEEARAREVIIGALKDLAIWHEKQDCATLKAGPGLLAVYQAVDKLAQSPIAELRAQAEATRATFVR